MQAKTQVEFLTSYLLASPEDTLLLVGSTGELGLWTPDIAPRATKLGLGQHRLATTLRPGIVYFKWAVANKENKILRWEECKNKSFVVPTSEDVITVQLLWNRKPRILQEDCLSLTFLKEINSNIALCEPEVYDEEFISDEEKEWRRERERKLSPKTSPYGFKAMAKSLSEKMAFYETLKEPSPEDKDECSQEPRSTSEKYDIKSIAKTFSQENAYDPDPDETSVPGIVYPGGKEPLNGQAVGRCSLERIAYEESLKPPASNESFTTTQASPASKDIDSDFLSLTEEVMAPLAKSESLESLSEAATNKIATVTDASLSEKNDKKVEKEVHTLQPSSSKVLLQEQNSLAVVAFDEDMTLSAPTTYTVDQAKLFDCLAHVVRKIVEKRAKIEPSGQTQLVESASVERFAGMLDLACKKMEVTMPQDGRTSPSVKDALTGTDDLQSSESNVAVARPGGILDYWYRSTKGIMRDTACELINSTGRMVDPSILWQEIVQQDTPNVESAKEALARWRGSMIPFKDTLDFLRSSLPPDRMNTQSVKELMDIWREQLYQQKNGRRSLLAFIPQHLTTVGSLADSQRTNAAFTTNAAATSPASAAKREEKKSAGVKKKSATGWRATVDPEDSNGSTSQETLTFDNQLSATSDWYKWSPSTASKKEVQEAIADSGVKMQLPTESEVDIASNQSDCGSPVEDVSSTGIAKPLEGVSKQVRCALDDDPSIPYIDDSDGSMPSPVTAMCLKAEKVLWDFGDDPKKQKLANACEEVLPEIVGDFSLQNLAAENDDPHILPGKRILPERDDQCILAENAYPQSQPRQRQAVSTYPSIASINGDFSSKPKRWAVEDDPSIPYIDDSDGSMPSPVTAMCLKAEKVLWDFGDDPKKQKWANACEEVLPEIVGDFSLQNLAAENDDPHILPGKRILPERDDQCTLAENAYPQSQPRQRQEVSTYPSIASINGDFSSKPKRWAVEDDPSIPYIDDSDGSMPSPVTAMCLKAEKVLWDFGDDPKKQKWANACEEVLPEVIGDFSLQNLASENDDPHNLPGKRILPERDDQCTLAENAYPQSQPRQRQEVSTNPSIASINGDFSSKPKRWAVEDDPSIPYIDDSDGSMPSPVTAMCLKAEKVLWDFGDDPKKQKWANACEEVLPEVIGDFSLQNLASENDDPHNLPGKRILPERDDQCTLAENAYPQSQPRQRQEVSTYPSIASINGDFSSKNVATPCDVKESDPKLKRWAVEDDPSIPYVDDSDGSMPSPVTAMYLKAEKVLWDFGDDPKKQKWANACEEVLPEVIGDFSLQNLASENDDPHILPGKRILPERDQCTLAENAFPQSQPRQRQAVSTYPSVSSINGDFSLENVTPCNVKESGPKEKRWAVEDDLSIPFMDDDAAVDMHFAPKVMANFSPQEKYLTAEEYDPNTPVSDDDEISLEDMELSDALQKEQRLLNACVSPNTTYIDDDKLAPLAQQEDSALPGDENFAKGLKGGEIPEEQEKEVIDWDAVPLKPIPKKSSRLLLPTPSSNLTTLTEEQEEHIEKSSSQVPVYETFDKEIHNGSCANNPKHIQNQTDEAKIGSGCKDTEDELHSEDTSQSSDKEHDKDLGAKELASRFSDVDSGAIKNQNENTSGNKVLLASKGEEKNANKEPPTDEDMTSDENKPKESPEGKGCFAGIPGTSTSEKSMEATAKGIKIIENALNDIEQKKITKKDLESFDDNLQLIKKEDETNENEDLPENRPPDRIVRRKVTKRDLESFVDAVQHIEENSDHPRWHKRGMVKMLDRTKNLIHWFQAKKDPFSEMASAGGQSTSSENEHIVPVDLLPDPAGQGTSGYSESQGASSDSQTSGQSQSGHRNNDGQAGQETGSDTDLSWHSLEHQASNSPPPIILRQGNVFPEPEIPVLDEAGPSGAEPSTSDGETGSLWSKVTSFTNWLKPSQKNNSEYYAALPEEYRDLAYNPTRAAVHPSRLAQRRSPETQQAMPTIEESPLERTNSRTRALWNKSMAVASWLKSWKRETVVPQAERAVLDEIQEERTSQLELNNASGISVNQMQPSDDSLMSVAGRPFSQLDEIVTGSNEPQLVEPEGAVPSPEETEGADSGAINVPSPEVPEQVASGRPSAWRSHALKTMAVGTTFAAVGVTSYLAYAVMNEPGRLTEVLQMLDISEHPCTLEEDGSYVRIMRLLGYAEPPECPPPELSWWDVVRQTITAYIPDLF